MENNIVKSNICLYGNNKTKCFGFPFVKDIINNNMSFMVLDSKCEYINKYYDSIKDNYNTVIINLRDLKRSDGFNILDYPYSLYNSGKIDRAIDIIKSIGYEIFSDDSVDSFWSIEASNLFTSIVLCLFEDAKREEINIYSVYNVLSLCDGADGINDLLKDYLETKDKFSSIYVSVSSIINAPVETKLSIYSFAVDKIKSIIVKENLSKILSLTTFNIDKEKPNAIFFINRDEDTRDSYIVSIFIKELYFYLIDNNISNFSFVLDNFDTINKIEGFNNIITSSLSRDIIFSIFVRDKESFIDKYTDNIIFKFIEDNDGFEDISSVNTNINYLDSNDIDIKVFDLDEYFRSI